ncbi:unnamed protein product, partial [Hymenolepis diminuta]
MTSNLLTSQRNMLTTVYWCASICLQLLKPTETLLFRYSILFINEQRTRNQSTT